MGGERFITDIFLLLNVAVMVLRLCFDGYITPEHAALVLAVFTVSRAITRADNFWRLFFSIALSVAQFAILLIVFSQGNPMYMGLLLAQLTPLIVMIMVLYGICYWMGFRSFSSRGIAGIVLLLLLIYYFYYLFITGSLHL